ncbi:MAG: hypothetical protein IKX54_05000 [Lachnospiraceae bacterium]|nr:hypothetical protein [Lachnospiraceae bacterium]
MREFARREHLRFLSRPVLRIVGFFGGCLIAVIAGYGQIAIIPAWMLFEALFCINFQAYDAERMLPLEESERKKLHLRRYQEIWLKGMLISAVALFIHYAYVATAPHETGFIFRIMDTLDDSERWFNNIAGYPIIAFGAKDACPMILHKTIAVVAAYVVASLMMYQLFLQVMILEETRRCVADEKPVKRTPKWFLRKILFGIPVIAWAWFFLGLMVMREYFAEASIGFHLTIAGAVIVLELCLIFGLTRKGMRT